MQKEKQPQEAISSFYLSIPNFMNLYYMITPSKNLLRNVYRSKKEEILTRKNLKLENRSDGLSIKSETSSLEDKKPKSINTKNTYGVLKNFANKKILKRCFCVN